MSSQQLDEEAIFHLARKIPALEDRETYLDQICAGDQQLRERVESLLEIHDNEQAFLKSDPAAAPTLDHTPLTEHPGTTIGRYHLREQIGEGGMGTVFVAEQERPIRRKVALKVIKPGMDSKAVVARFEAERQALALMDHPNIAKVLDAGTTDSGRPYFVMELVRGIPITEYCDQHKLTIRERLELFTQVCQAIQHAHQKAIIHRDIKPTNVLVTEQDGKAVPKVIDFGVAKALNQRLTDRTIYTTFAQVVGTPLYMSPEQAALSAVDVDTRSDVYSLGVLLYELLTGTTPFDKQRFEQAAYDEIRRIVREEEPPKPSTKISTLGDLGSSVADNRRTDCDKLTRAVRGDMDWIVMRAMEKDRSRRYETANGLAADVVRLLADEPIEARPPSAGYRLRKFTRRNKWQAVTAVAILAVFSLGFCGTMFGFLKWRNEAKKLEEIVHRYHEELVENLILAALNGQSELYESAFEKAKQNNVREEVLDATSGLASLLCYGDEGGAVEQLKQIPTNQDDRIVSSVLSLAYISTGRMALGLEVADNIDPEISGDEPDHEQLLVSYSTQFSTTEHDRTVRELTALVSRRTNWGLAKAFLASSQSIVADERKDYELSLSAVRNADKACELLPSSPYTKALALYSHIVAANLAKRELQDDTAHVHRAGQLASELELFPNYMLGRVYRQSYFDELSDFVLAEREYQALVSLGYGGPIVQAAAAYGKGDLEQALDNLEKLEAIEMREADLCRALVAIDQLRPEDACERFRELLASDAAPYTKTIALAIPLLLGDYELAKAGSSQIWDECDEEIRSQTPTLELLAHGTDAADVEKKAEDRGGWQLGMNRFILGMHFLSHNERDKARSQFQQLAHSSGPAVPGCMWARAFLVKMNDLSWPPKPEN